MLCNLKLKVMGMFQSWKRGQVGRAVERVERVDQQSREVRHDLKNIQMRTDRIARLFSEMREDAAWRREERES